MLASNSHPPWALLRSWISAEESSVLRSEISKSIFWSQPSINLFGKNFLVPRRTAFIGKRGLLYSYSGVTHEAKGWSDWIVPLLVKLNELCFCEFNACLLNLYKDGNDSMGWHSDDESELNHAQPIASLSLGSTRDFALKHRFEHKKTLLELNDGDLLIMYPPCQSEWLHSLPKRRNVNQSRINLTFRCLLTNHQ